MGNNYNRRLCPRVILANEVTFAGGVLTLNIPAGTYLNHARYHLVIADTVPDETTAASTIVVTIGDDATTYPLLLCNGVQATYRSMLPRTRWVYPVVFNTDVGGGGNFRLLSSVWGIPDVQPFGVTVEPAAAPAGGDGA